MKNCLKKILAFILTLAFVFSSMNIQVSAESFDVPGGSREVVLVLDSSGSMYNTPIVTMKKAAIKFCENMLDAEGYNKIAIVSYSSSVNKTLQFTSDIDDIKSFVNSMYASGGTNIADGLERAKYLLDNSNTVGKKILYYLQMDSQRMAIHQIQEDMIVWDLHIAVNMEIIFMIIFRII